jgi:DEAD/DEAH box helicase domain-containing protein
MNPLESPAAVAIALLKSALSRKLRSIVYCQSRRMTELISLWASEQSGPYARRISAYRAGFLPEERRGIEARMASGELLAVISTSALELGIDIGNLDLCILVGYPGTVMSTLQRGGRVGRSSRESAVVLVAGEDALDQYIVRHADNFFSRPPAKVELNPDNPVILEQHLECAAAELPLRLRGADARRLSPAAMQVVAKLEQQSRLLRSADGSELMAARKRPHRDVALRGSGKTVSIENEAGELIGSVDGIRAQREAHPGAIYLHLGRHYEITELDLAAGRALARLFRPSWYTRARGHK